MKQNRYKTVLFCLPMLTALILITACSHGEDDILPPEQIPYTTLVYMMADNPMDSQVDYTINELKKGARRSAGTTVVYVDRMEEAPRLFKITQTGEEVPLKSYAEESSADPRTLARVIGETKALVPCSRFGLVLWGHSLGWLPSGYASSLAEHQSAAAKASCMAVGTRYMGPDIHPGDDLTVSSMMEIDALARALPDHVAEYIWFDVCLMGNVESFYQLRDKCRLLVASPTEVLADGAHNASGIPYSKLLPFLFGGADELKTACAGYMSHYRSMKHDILRSATITLADAGEMPALYDAARTILKGRLADVEQMDLTTLQSYHSSEQTPRVYFDMADILRSVATDADYQAFSAQLDRTLLYKDATDKFMSLPIDKAHFSGLSMYVPLRKWSRHHEYEYYFGNLKWSGVYK